MTTFNLVQGLMILLFSIGYFFVTIEHWRNINKSGIVLFLAAILWTIQFLAVGTPTENNSLLLHHLSNTAQIVFFILSAMAIVEMINVHKGFQIISDSITFRSKRQLLWIIGILTFFLSSILDNLTTTIIMIAFLQKIFNHRSDRLIMGGAVVIAANAGGAWTPIGDVTTTMLWIGGQITTFQVMKSLFVPSFACLLASLACLRFSIEGELDVKPTSTKTPKEPLCNLMLFLGVGSLVFVPIFKLLTGLPPFMGILLGLSVMWLVSDIFHYGHQRNSLLMPHVFSRIDVSGILFFLGILLSVAALDSAGILNEFAQLLGRIFTNPHYVAVAIGVVSAILDNIPLVAASMGMYTTAQFPADSSFWQLIALCAGTGGSLLIIGSAAGVAFMNMEKVSFFSYVRKIGLAALVGYAAGIAVYLISL
jgi:Na+/H+ antiporter NhaD/arsenite permease-like protein